GAWIAIPLAGNGQMVAGSGTVGTEARQRVQHALVDNTELVLLSAGEQVVQIAGAGIVQIATGRVEKLKILAVEFPVPGEFFQRSLEEADDLIVVPLLQADLQFGGEPVTRSAWRSLLAVVLPRSKTEY